MSATRRRFIAVSAAAIGAALWPRRSEAVRWRGHALGAEAEMTLHAAPEVAEPALAEALEELRRVEALFSLYDPASALRQLNARGALDPAPAQMRALLGLCDRMHRATAGRFDPTVQPLWTALARGEDTSAARAAVDWSRVRRTHRAVYLGNGQQLTLNGIAQGWASDRVRAALKRHGLTHALVSIGEISAEGGPWRIGIADPDRGVVDRMDLHSGAIATSSPGAMALRPGGHVIDPRSGDSGAFWSTVSVEAADAATADGLSTALCLAPLATAATILKRVRGARRAWFVDTDGTVLKL